VTYAAIIEVLSAVRLVYIARMSFIGHSCMVIGITPPFVSFDRIS